MSSMLLDHSDRFLEYVLSDGRTVETVETFSSSFLVSNLLPTTIAHLGPIASLQTNALYLFAHLSICDMSSHPFILQSILQSIHLLSICPLIYHVLALFSHQ